MVDQLAANLSDGGILTTNASFGSGTRGNNGPITEEQQKVVESATAGNLYGAASGYCEEWAEKAILGHGGVYCCATKAWEADGVSTSKDNIPVGACVYGHSNPTAYDGDHEAGHVGIYIGNGKVVSNAGDATPREQSLESWASDYPWRGWGWMKGKDLSKGGTGTATTASSSTATASKPSSLDEIFFIGDSITVGLGAEKLSKGSYKGVSGSTTENWVKGTSVSYIQNGEKCTIPNIDNKYKAISIMLGANEPGSDVNSVINNMKTILKTLHNKYPDKMIYVQKVWYAGGLDKNTYNSELEKMCKDLEYAVCIDPTSGVQLQDAAHPVDGNNGYGKYYENLKTAINNADLSGKNVGGNSDGVMLKGSLDLKKTGLTKDTLRDMILASYVTQATTDTVIGIEIPEGDMDPILKGALESYVRYGSVPRLAQLQGITNFTSKLVSDWGISDFSQDGGGNHITGDRWGYFRFGKFYYYAIEQSDLTYKYYLAERGIIKVLDANNKPIKCYSNGRFDGYLTWFNGEGNAVNGEAAANTYRSGVFYTVPEIGKIKIMSINDDNGNFSFSGKEVDYAKETEISSATIPMELLIDFLNISASSDFMSAFEELVKDQEIVMKILPTVVTTDVQTHTEQVGNASAEVTATAHYDKIELPSLPNPLGEGEEQQEQEPEPEPDPGYDVTTTETLSLNPITITSDESSRTVSVNYDLVLEKANTWFMRAQRDIKASTIVNGPNTETSTIPARTIAGEGESALSIENVGVGNSAALHAELVGNDIFTRLKGLAAKWGYIINPARSSIVVNSSQVDFQEGTKSVTTTITTESFSKGTMKYDDNTDAFLGLWKNKDGKYHKYAPKYDKNGKVIGVADEACYAPDGKKVGYHDLYEDEDSYVADLFVNADDILLDLLDLSENTQSTTHIMKYILWRYNNKDYGVTDFEVLLRLLGIYTSKPGDYNVNTKSSSGEKLKIIDTEDGKTAEQNLIDGIRSITNPAYRSYCMVYVDRGYTKRLIELQEQYGVNPAWIVAQSYFETHCGRTGSGPAPVNNWWGWDVYGGHTHAFPSPEDCFEQICKQLADPAYTGYFQNGNETIDAILDVWTPKHSDDYPAVTKEIVHDILIGAGVDVGTIGGEILDVCQQVTDHYNEIGAYYSIGSDLIYGNVEACWDNRAICCATYVSVVLHKSGLLTPEHINRYGFHSTFSIPSMLKDAGWTEVPSGDMQPGDVLNRAGTNDEGGHVMIYAGDGLVWDQNTCTGSRVKGPFHQNLAGYTAYRAP